MGKLGGTAENPGAHAQKSSPWGRRGQKSCLRPGLLFISADSYFCAQITVMGQGPFLQSKGICGHAVGMEERTNPKKGKNSVPDGVKEREGPRTAC